MMFCCQVPKQSCNELNAEFIYYQFDRNDPKTHQKQFVQIKHFPHNKYDQYTDWRSTKVLSQDFNQIMESVYRSHKNFQDSDFPHDDASLGYKYDKKIKWVRLQTLIENPVYYSSESLASLTRFQCSNKALEIAICILAECQTNLLKNHMLHTLNFEGIYQYSFMKDGVIRNVVIDDYIPCFDNKPVFCSPYNLNETFGMLIEKALAKVFGCYKDIPDNPIQLLEVIGCTPVTVHRILNKHSKKQKCEKFLALTCNTPKEFRLLSNDDPAVRDYGLHPLQAYKILGTYSIVIQEREINLIEISHQNDKISGWNGNFSECSDLWKKVQSQPKDQIFKKIHFNQSFVMPLLELNTFFKCAFAIENLSEQSVDWLRLRTDAHHAVYCQFTITHSCDVYLRLQTAQECRQVFILVEHTQNNDYHFIKGRMLQQTKITSFSDCLKQGHYVLFVKTEWKVDDEKQATIFLSSRQHIRLRQSLKKEHPNLIDKTFRGLIELFPKTEFKTALQDVTYLTKVLYRQCGYALLWVAVAPTMRDSLIIEYDERNLSLQGFKVRKPFSAKSTIVVKAGSSILVTLKVLNRFNINIEEVRFPSYDFRFQQPSIS